jgi:hypothetical protein
MCGLTFELSGRQRQDARARPQKMYSVPVAGPWWPAVGAPLERGVRQHQRSAFARGDLAVQTCLLLYGRPLIALSQLALGSTDFHPA